MAKTVESIKGMNDILPAQTSIWQFVEKTLTSILSQYAYQEIRLPIVEATNLFKRSIGEVTDIVEKEMYTFTDLNSDSLSLRPEGTAGCVRAGIQHSLFYGATPRLWYSGPMFRHENPQKGRYRQFYQFGVEAFGFEGSDIEVEMILITKRFWQALGIEQQVKLQINSLATSAARVKFRDVLIDYFQQNEDKLDEDSKRRLTKNPLRILDSKNPDLQDLINNAPSFQDYWDEDAKQHFDSLCASLDAVGVEYEINPRLVRGLDYYSHTVFEWVTDALGSQGTICAGGRFDNLIAQLGGKKNSAMGFALGIERLILLMQSVGEQKLSNNPDIYMVLAGEDVLHYGLSVAEQIRTACPNISLQMHCGGGSYKSQFKKADKSGANIALVIGDEEMQNQKITVKHLREHQDQAQYDIDELIKVIDKR